MHVKAYLLNGVSDIRVCECEILKHNSEASVQGGILDGETYSGMKFSSSVNRGGIRITKEHVGML